MSKHIEKAKKHLTAATVSFDKVTTEILKANEALMAGIEEDEKHILNINNQISSLVETADGFGIEKTKKEELHRRNLETLSKIEEFRG
jgi:hypothetical protein